jgi:hypothetical protein
MVLDWPRDDAIPRPARLLAQNSLRQIFWLFHSNATVTEIAALLVK